MKALFIIAILYLPSLLLVSGMTGHLYYLGDEALFFSSNDAQGYRLIADYYTSLGNATRPSNHLLTLRAFMFPLYLGLYHVIGIAGIQVLQMVMNAISLWLVFISATALAKRSWIAGISTALLAVTPSFNFLVFHGLTETLSTLLICVFITLIVSYFHDYRRTRLFWATCTLSLLMCVRPITLPFWTLCLVYYVIVSARERWQSLWRPFLAVVPVLVQLTVAAIMTGSPTISSAGRVALSDWYFPVVYEVKEYGRFVSRKSDEAEQGMKRFPELKEKLAYIARNYREAIAVYSSILVRENLIAGSNFVRPPGKTEDRGHKYLQKWSAYLNGLFAAMHAAVLPVMIGLIAYRRRMHGKEAMLVCYGFALSLILPAGLAYWQGDRYVVLAEPLWLVAYSAVVGFFLDCLTISNKARSQRRGPGIVQGAMRRNDPICRQSSGMWDIPKNVAYASVSISQMGELLRRRKQVYPKLNRVRGQRLNLCLPSRRQGATVLPHSCAYR